MKRTVIQQFAYPFAWLDETIEVTLNPEKSRPSDLTAGELVLLSDKFRTESRQIFSSLKAQTFQLFSAEAIRVLAGQYDLTVHILLLQVKNNSQYLPQNAGFQQTCNFLLSGLGELRRQIRIRYADFLPKDPPKGLPGTAVPAAAYKINCKLSVDQLGIIFRSADETKVIIAGSFSAVCQTVAPYLSTERRENIAWDSMRSNSNRPEERDKAVVIAALEKMIGKIKEY